MQASHHWYFLLNVEQESGTMAGHTGERHGGGDWLYPDGSVKNMSLTSQGLSVQIIDIAMGISSPAEGHGVQTASLHAILVVLKQHFQGTSMVHPWVRWRAI